MKCARMYAAIGMTIWGLCFSFNSIASEEKEEEAVEAAKTWIALIDKGKYGESW
jgi:hypothetical protein